MKLPLRPLTLSFLFLLSFASPAWCEDKVADDKKIEDQSAAVEALARVYIDAIKAGNEGQIFALLYPGIFDSLTPEETVYLKRKWSEQFKMYEKPLRLPTNLKVTKLNQAIPMPGSRWVVPPEYQVQIDIVPKTTPEGSPSRPNLSAGMMEAVASKDGRFYILRPLPAEATLKKMMENDAARTAARQPVTMKPVADKPAPKLTPTAEPKPAPAPSPASVDKNPPAQQ